VKYLYIGVVILAVILAFCFVSSALLGRYTGEAAARLGAALTLAGQDDFSGAARQVEAAMRDWERHKGLWGVVLQHDESDEVLTSFHALLAYARCGDDAEFAAGCAELICRVEHVAEMEKPLYYNVL